MVEQCDENCNICRKMDDHWRMMVATVCAAGISLVLGLMYAGVCHILEGLL